MYVVTIETLGIRLKQIRLYLSISQQELKEKCDINQATISRMESGKGIKWGNFIKILSFYSQYIYIDCLFQENFQIISIDGKKEIFKSNINSIVKQLVTQSIVEYQKNINDLVAKSNKDFKDSFEKSLEELNERVNEKIEQSLILISD